MTSCERAVNRTRVRKKSKCFVARPTCFGNRAYHSHMIINYNEMFPSMMLKTEDDDLIVINVVVINVRNF